MKNIVSMEEIYTWLKTSKHSVWKHTNNDNFTDKITIEIPNCYFYYHIYANKAAIDGSYTIELQRGTGHYKFQVTESISLDTLKERIRNYFRKVKLPE